MTIQFLDGPAEGQKMLLGAAPEILRVVRSRSSGRWDALDQPGDEPSADEDVFLYRRVGDVKAHGHMDMMLKGRRVGVSYVSADYVLAEQSR